MDGWATEWVDPKLETLKIETLALTTQTDMAVYLDTNRGHISDIERGKREAGIITLQVIAAGLGTTMSKLLSGL
jgi:transcriptional regulator with XRE-family HTH domain